MKSRWQLLLYMTSLPMDIVGWLVVLFVRVAWGENLRWESPYARTGGKLPGGPVLSCDIRAGSFPVTAGRWPRGFYLQRRNASWRGTSIGHSVFYGPGWSRLKGWAPTQVHEHVHVEQYEAAMLGAFVLGVALALVGMPIIGAFVWSTGGLVMLLANWTTAMLRGEDAYRGSHHEEAAYAIAAAYEEEKE